MIIVNTLIILGWAISLISTAFLAVPLPLDSAWTFPFGVIALLGMIFYPLQKNTPTGRKRAWFQLNTLFLPWMLLTQILLHTLPVLNMPLTEVGQLALFILLPLGGFLSNKVSIWGPSLENRIFPPHPNSRAMMRDEVAKVFLRIGVEPQRVCVFFHHHNFGLTLFMEDGDDMDAYKDQLQEATKAINTQMMCSRFEESWRESVKGSDIFDHHRYSMEEISKPDIHALVPKTLSAHERLSLLA